MLAASGEGAEGGAEDGYNGNRHDDNVAAHLFLVAIDVGDRNRQQHDSAIDEMQSFFGVQAGENNDAPTRSCSKPNAAVTESKIRKMRSVPAAAPEST